MLQLKYSSFLESKTIQLINESKLFFSPKLRSQLTSLDNEVAKELLSIENTDIKPDITFVDDSSKEGYLSFITMRNASKLIKSVYPHIEDFGETGNVDSANALWDTREDPSVGADVYRKSRNILKIGKFVNSVLPKKFTDKQIEEFVNQFKAYQETNGEKIQIVEGEDISYWYDESNYLKDDGNLGGSCMRYSAYGPRGFFEIYVENPEVCRMLILTEGGKLKGRAIIWKLDSVSAWNKNVEFEYFLDRQYTSVDSDAIKMRNYAEEQGWAIKTYNSHSSIHNVTYKGESFNASMKVQVKSEDYSKYPYMDTFKVYDPNTGELTNSDGDEEFGSYRLDSTGGGYTDIEEQGFYSEYYDENISEDDAIYSEPLGTYIYSNRAVEVEHGSYRHRGWYPEDHEDIRYSEMDSAWYYHDDAYHSEYYDDYIFSDDVVEIVDDVWDDGDTGSSGSTLKAGDDDYVSFNDLDEMTWYNKLKDNNYWGEFQGIMKTCLVENYKKEWILKNFVIDVYPTKESEKTEEVEYLSELDAYILKIEVNKHDGILMDKFEYYKRISGEDEKQPDRVDEIKDKCKQMSNKSQLELDLDTEETKSAREELMKKVDERLQEFEDGLFD